VNALPVNAEAFAAGDDDAGPVIEHSNAILVAMLDQVRRHPWPARTTFNARLAMLERLLQRHFDRLPNVPFVPRVEMKLRLSLDDLALIRRGRRGSQRGRDSATARAAPSP